MKQVLHILTRDLSRLMRNWVAMLVIVGVCLLPSFYAWFNIAANYDPYSNTAGIQIAVANNDLGAQSDLVGTLNAGEKIIENLRENEDLGWVFLDEAQAVEGVRSGAYYAAIVIPADFSECLVSVLSGELRQPAFHYYLNEKKNAIAPKITDTGASTIQEQVNSEFVSVVSETAAEILEDAAADLESEMDTTQQSLLTRLEQVTANLAGYQTALDQFQEALDQGDGDITQARDALQQVRQAAEEGALALEQGAKALSSGREDAAQLSEILSNALHDGEDLLVDISNTAGKDLGGLDGKIQTVSSRVGEALGFLEDVIALNGQIIESLERLDTQIPGSPAADLIAQLTEENQRHQSLLDDLKAANNAVSSASGTAADTASELSRLVRKNQRALREVRADFTQNIQPELGTSMDNLAALSGEMAGILSNIGPTADQLDGVLTSLQSNLETAGQTLASTASTLSAVQAQLEQVRADLSGLQSLELYGDLRTLAGLDAQTVSDFMASPVELTTQVLYPVENYGSALGPFYTNLAIWVGGIVLIAILKLEVDRDERLRRLRAAQAYFGRWLLFVLLGLVQALIVCLGDLYLLDIQCVAPAHFLLAGLVASLVYVSIIYALSVTFKHIGKALSVILVILQIPGSAGTYPIEMTPAFFQWLHPLLPFTYGIDAMREAVAGFYAGHYWQNLLCLAAFFPLSLLIGLGVRPWMLNLNRMFDKRLEQTDLMICEAHGLTRERFSLSAMVHVLAGDETFREELLLRARRFEASYPKRIRRGFLAVIVIPLIFLALMFGISSKMVFLVLWIVSIVLISLYLICIEYIHESLQRKLRLLDTPREELLAGLKGTDGGWEGGEGR